mmetsp:Transcript_2398/g.9396  ORF Transcript_2398/g.9396 Transcript_2398/m.9396 type:complete len:273 (-) Transcript_2398:1559-2377(-)
MLCWLLRPHQQCTAVHVLRDGRHQARLAPEFPPRGGSFLQQNAPWASGLRPCAPQNHGLGGGSRRPGGELAQQRLADRQPHRHLDLTALPALLPRLLFRPGEHGLVGAAPGGLPSFLHCQLVGLLFVLAAFELLQNPLVESLPGSLVGEVRRRLEVHGELEVRLDILVDDPHCSLRPQLHNLHPEGLVTDPDRHACVLGEGTDLGLQGLEEQCAGLDIRYRHRVVKVGRVRLQLHVGRQLEPDAPDLYALPLSQAKVVHDPPRQDRETGLDF